MVKRSSTRWLPALIVAGTAGCTAIVGVNQDYELDPTVGKGGSSVTAAGAGPGGTGGGGTGAAAGTGGTETGGASSDGGGNDAGGASGSGGSADASAGAGGSSGSRATGGASGGGGSGGISGAGGLGGASGSTGAGGASGNAGVGGNGAAGSGGTGNAGSAGTADAAGTGGSAGSAGAGGSSLDAGDVSTDGAAGAPIDASSEAAADAREDLGSPCGPGTKFCGVCVATVDPNYGCAGVSCAPCELNGTATCTSGNCVVTGCNNGYHQAGNACLVNVPEICTNGIDDDGDVRVDCLDPDCAGDASCTGKCMDAIPIPCDTIVTGQNNGAAGSTSRLGAYSCSSGMYTASEYAYRFAGGANQRVYAEIYGLSGNLALFEIGVPSGSQCVAGTSCGAYSDGAASAGAEAIGFIAQPAQDYYLLVDGSLVRNYSLSVQCSTLDGCWPRRPIEPGQSFSATNNPTSGASNVTASKVPSYNCGGFNIGETGPEAAWIFTPTTNANYRVSMTGLSADCDLFVLPANDCGGACLGPTTYSDGFGNQSEIVNFQGVANTTYYIVVDGYSDAVCNFTLALTQL
ncbi:MAG TPA: hypothetical protein VK550_33475 [Polyangiaceae bacterium]|nr:hypothetical protein [Polyangiaceae bacterium]